ncbi:DUF2141 domain-containing protein [Flavobacterium granuli]|uniref:Uncharacterized protein (DUF2141 family) n=1 Tax=Flavobacterium granuli TaxID=280093 RepID=A0ABU1RXD0_9FLAO|nr:DUF2141 domain-containing protein [Flavobacterium granuli]MDR6843422.1 uncharacterized protein (DUF2141 family) [Flavobacterium granuli]
MNYLLFLFISLYNFSFEAEKFDLKITVTNVKTQKGSVEVGIFNNEKSFLLKGKEYRTGSKVVTNDTIVFVLKDLTQDDYAISLYQDINSDKKCNLNFIGIPTEPYGFSNNFKPKFSKPTFNDCKIEINNNKSIMIKLLD